MEDAETVKLPEVEITPEMIEAGLAALDSWDVRDPSEWKVLDVYRAMTKAKEYR